MPAFDPILPQGAAGAWTRRDFLKIAAAATVAAAGQTAGAAAPSGETKMPQLQLGGHSFSRLICGSNPFNGGSHLSTFVNREMKAYYTDEQNAKTLRRCLEVGINCWQLSSVQRLDVYRRLIDEGAPLQLISLSQNPKDLPVLKQAGCLGVAHHGEVTDKLFKAGQLDKVNEFVKQVRGAGLLAGVSTHMPAVVDAIEAKGWDLDYYMTCVYERNRGEAEFTKLLGHAPLPVNEVYLKSDPPRMFQAIRRTKRTCLAFKILAGGRLADRREWVEQAFRETFAAIKPNDGVIIGIYDRYNDQPAEDAAWARRYGLSS